MAALAPRPFDQPRQLLVEGRAPERFFLALLSDMKLTGVQVQNYGGIDDLAPFLRTMQTDPNFTSQIAWLGIVRDAEANSAVVAFQSVCSILQNCGLPAPRQLMTIEAGTPSVSVFILPDCANAGMLEDLCLAAVAGDPALPCVDEYISCLQRQGVSVPTNVAKTKLQTFLASRDTPGLLLGEAAHKGYFPWNHSAFDPIKRFLHGFQGTP
jgi:hypothetical protein